MIEKHCNNCGILKFLDQFNRRPDSRDGHNHECKECQGYRSWVCKLKKDYSMVPDNFEMLYQIQDGCCGICGIPENAAGKRFSVDHEHGTINIRGLLCNPCNMALGVFGDNIEGLQKVFKYLELKPYKFGEGEY